MRSPTRWPWLVALGTAAVLAGLSAAGDEPPSGPGRTAGGRPIRNARSIGAPQDGSLENGRRLRESEALRYLKATAVRGRVFGTEELVALLRRASESVAVAFPGSHLRVGDLSARGGGDVHMHASHESGRDADVAFYLRGRDGGDLEPPDYVTIGADGRSADGAAVFDDARNWTFVAAVLSDRRAAASHVFVAEHLKARLLAAGRTAGAAPALLEKAERMLTQPRGAFAHDNHFHVRVSCARDDKPDCVEGLRRRRH